MFTWQIWLVGVAGGVVAAAVGGAVLMTSGPLAPGGDGQEPDQIVSSPTAQLSRAAITTLTGGPASRGEYRDGPPGTAKFGDLTGIVVAPDGNIYVADFDNRVIVRIDAAGVATRIAGNGARSVADGAALEASFYSPGWLAADGRGVVYVGDSYGHRIRRITPDGRVDTLAGGGPTGFVDDSFRDGRGEDARFNGVAGIAVAANGDLIVADYNNNRIRRVTPDGVVSTIAGTGQSGHRDGPADQAVFNFPAAVALGPDGSIFLTEHGNNNIRRISTDGVVSTVPVKGALSYPSGLVATATGLLLVADTQANRILAIDQDGNVMVLAGNGEPGFADGAGLDARLDNPAALALASSSAAFVTDRHNAAVRRVSMQ
jgi:sugar lactone lactonase YvrE